MVASMEGPCLSSHVIIRNRLMAKVTKQMLNP